MGYCADAGGVGAKAYPSKSSEGSVVEREVYPRARLRAAGRGLGVAH
jgi:hypothetical protein